MGEYDVGPATVGCKVICGGGCTLACIGDTGIPVLDVTGMFLSVSDEFYE